MDRSIMFSTVPYLEREKLKRTIDDFLQKLSDIKITEDNVIPCISESDVFTLENEPVIKDEMILLRLEHYIKLALTVNLDENPESGVAAIERCFQIVGESMILGEGETPTVAKSLLGSSLSKTIKGYVKKIRNNLSHWSRKSLAGRMDVGSDTTFFKKLQQDLKDIREAFRHIFEIQSLRMEKYALENGIDLLEAKLKEMEARQTDCSEELNAEDFRRRSESSEDIKIEYPNHSDQSNFKEVKKKFVTQKHYLEQRLKETITKLLERSKDFVPLYTMHFKNHLEELEGMHKHLEALAKNKKDYSDELKRLSQKLHSLKILLDFVVSVGDFDLQTRGDHQERVYKLKANPEFGEITEVLKDFSLIISDITSSLTVSNKATEVVQFENGEHIQKFKDVLSRSCYLSLQTVEKIKSAVPKRYVEHHEAKEELEKLFEAQKYVPKSKIDSLRKKLVLNEKDARKVEVACDDRSSKKVPYIVDHFHILLQGLKENRLSPTHYDIICDEFNFSEEIRAELGKIVLGYVAIDKTLQYFYDRLEKLENVVINQYDDIEHLWKKGKSLKTREFTRDKLVAYYVQDPLMQSAVEQLVFDCSVVLTDKHTTLDHLWLKTSYLFNGINLRNILAHGNPLCECTSPILDPWDFPNEMITKVFELLDDIDAIQAMCDLEKALQETVTNSSDEKPGFEKFVSVVESEGSDEFNDFRENIKCCKNWKCYARLIPERRRPLIPKPSEPLKSEEGYFDDENELR